MNRIIRTAIPAALLCAASATASYLYLKSHWPACVLTGPGYPADDAERGWAPPITALPAPVPPASGAAFTPAQQAAIGEIAGQYLETHPEVLVEASRQLQAQQQARQAARLTGAALANREALMALKNVPVAGPADSAVIVTEFFDYQCSACAAMAPAMEAVMAARPDVRYAFRDWTIFAGRWPASGDAAARGLDVWRQKGAAGYMAYHNGIYRTGHDEGRLTTEDIESVARAAGAGPEDAARRPVSQVLTAANDALAQQLGLTGTPGIIVMPAKGADAGNTTVFPGVVSAETLRAAIDRAEKPQG